MAAWFAMSAQFISDPKIEAVGEEIGPAGPLAAVALLCHAKAQGDGGRVERTFRALGHEIFADREVAVSAVRTLVSAGVLTLEHEDETSFIVKFPAWRRWQEAFRKARSRAHEQADVRKRPQVSGSRPHASPTQTQTTTETITPHRPPKGGSANGARPRVNRKPVTDPHLELAEQVIDSFNETAHTSMTVGAHLSKIVMRLREHPELTADDHRRIIRASFAEPWWSGRPGPQVIYGNAACFEQAIERAKAGDGSMESFLRPER